MVFLRDIALNRPALRPHDIGEAAFEAFSADGSLNVIAIVDALERPIGLLSRIDFLTRFGDRFGRALWERRPIAKVMNDHPVVLSGLMPLEDAAVAISVGPAFTHGFIVTDPAGRYHGVCDGPAMLRANVTLQEQRAEQLARFADALDALMRLQRDTDLATNEETQWRVLEITANALNVRRIACWTLAAGGEQMRRLGLFDSIEGRDATPAVIEARDCPHYLRCLAQTRVTAITDMGADPRVAELRSLRKGHGMGAMVDAQIISDQKLFGVLTLEHPDGPRHWTKDEIAFIGSVSDRIGLIHQSLQIQRLALRAEAGARAKSQFLATMSHEIRTPMNGVLGMTQALRETALSPDQRRMVDLIARTGDDLMVILNDILDFSRIEAGQITLETKAFDLSDFVARQKVAHGLRANEKGIAFEAVLDPALAGWREGDALRLGQVVTNLLSNAVKFTERGEVRLSIHPDDENHVLIEVSDTGIGMTPEQSARVFDQFSQADASTTRRFGGTGLGLAIVKGLVERMGGTITIASAPGQGTRVQVRLSLPATTAPAAERAPAAQTGDISGLRVLIADDNAANRMVLAAMLQPRGVEVVQAVDGAEAFNVTAHSAFDAILMDINMPVMDGVAALHAIRDAERATATRRTPIIAVTANALPSQIADYVSKGFDCCLPKPIRLAELVAMLADVTQPDQARQAA
jgi:signal transduction histidine kinase/ActR/RegA family two-component response regulator